MLITLKDVSKTYNPGRETEVRALRNVDLEVAEGELISVTGPSGSGKSTLLHILAGLDTPTSGTYFFENMDVTRASDRAKCALRSRRIGVVLQDLGLLGDDTALENVCLPLTINKVNRKKAIKRAKEVLEQMGITDLAGKRVNTLSGGQRQRVAVARALAQGARLLLADEPTGALDSRNTEALMDFLEVLNRSGLTIIVVTHDPAVSRRAPISYTLMDGVLKRER